MLIKSDHSSTAPPPPTKCVQCGAEERRLLHHVRHRGIFRRLCTNCVLRHHPQSFCPTCFQVYPPTPSNDAILACSKCFSSSHSHCVTSYTKPYICPLCANPNASIFQLKKVRDSAGDVDISNREEFRLMDRDAAKKLLAAAKIAMLTMNKAALAARGEAERRAKDAAVARKRAREALEHVAHLAVKDKLRRREVDVGVLVSDDYVKRENSVNVVNSGHWNAVVSSGAGPSVIVEEKVNVTRSGDYVKRENSVKNVVNSGHGNGVVSRGAGPSVIIEEKMDEVVDVERVEGSDKVMTALGAVELKEHENVDEPTVEDVGLEITMDDHVLVMDVDDHVSMSVNARVDAGGLIVEMNIENDEAIFAGGENGEENLSKQEDVDVDGVQYEENGNDEEHADGAQ